MRNSIGLLISSILMVFVSVVGCTREVSTRRPHEGAPSAGSPSDTSSAAGNSIVPSALRSMDASEFDLRLKVRLNRKNMEADKRAQTADRRTELYNFILQAGELVSNPSSTTEIRTSILDTFSETLTEGCSENLSDCRYVSLFRGQDAAISMTLLLAERSENLNARYRMLALAYALVGQVDNPRISIAYIRTAEAYETELAKRTDKASRAKLEQHREISDQAITKLQFAFGKTGTKVTSNQDAELIKTLEASLNIWNFDRVRRIEATTRDEALLSIVAPKLLEGTRLAEENQSLAGLPQSAVSKLAKVPVAARKALGVPEVLPSDLQTFIFDNLWLGRLTPVEADIIWKAHVERTLTTGTRENPVDQAQVALLAYARTRLLLSAKDVNAIMTGFFNSKGTYATANAFQDGLKESLKGQTMWADSTRRFELLRQFSDRNLRSADQETKNVKELDLFFASINRNIKILSTYPSMLVMSYHLARVGFSLKMRTWTGTIEIRAGQILDWFFEGVLDPWMAYGTDFRKLSKSEISLVFYYALETGVLTDGGVDLEHLFKMLTEQMAGPIRSDVEKIDDAMRVTFDESPTASDFHRLCASMERSKGSSALIGAPKLALTALKHYTMLGTPQASPVERSIHPTFSAGWSFFETERLITKMRLDENLEVIRLELTPKINRIRLMAKLTADYLTRHETKDSDKVIKQIDAKIQPLEKLRSRTYTRIFKLVKQIGPCGEKLTSMELQAQEHVIRGLINHFREVHGVMKARRAKIKDLRSDETQVVDHRFGFSGKVEMAELEKHEAGLGVSADSYRLSRLQALLRITDLLENGFEESGTKFLPKRERGSIILPTRLRDIEADWREKVLRLDWNDDTDEFVTNGIQQIFDPRFGFATWSNLTLLSYSAQLRIRAMSALAKAGLVQTDQGPQRLEMKEVIRLALVMEKWIEIEGTPWASILNITGEYTRAQVSLVLDQFVWEKSDHAFRGLLDYVFDMITSDKLGEGSGEGGDAESPRFTRRTGPWNELYAHAQVANTFGEPTLNIPAGTMLELTEVYTRGLNGQMALIPEMVNEVKRLEPLRAANPSVFPSWRIYASRKHPVVPILSASVVDMFRAKSLEFSRQTGYKLEPAVQTALKFQ